MTGGAIAARAIADAALRELATEYGGPRPAGTPARDMPAAEDSTSRATRP